MRCSCFCSFLHITSLICFTPYNALFISSFTSFSPSSDSSETKNEHIAIFPFLTLTKIWNVWTNYKGIFGTYYVFLCLDGNRNWKRFWLANLRFKMSSEKTFIWSASAKLRTHDAATRVVKLRRNFILSGDLWCDSDQSETEKRRFFYSFILFYFLQEFFDDW